MNTLRKLLLKHFPLLKALWAFGKMLMDSVDEHGEGGRLISEREWKAASDQAYQMYRIWYRKVVN